MNSFKMVQKETQLFWISLICLIGFISQAFSAQILPDSVSESLIPSQTQFNRKYLSTSSYNPKNAFTSSILLRRRRQDFEIGCVMPINMPNGTYSLLGAQVEEGQLAPHYSIIELKCPKGSVVSTNSKNFCDGRKNDWFEKLATCQRNCKPPTSLTIVYTCLIPSDNGFGTRVRCTGMLPTGTIAYPNCQSGHFSADGIPQGNISCNNGFWSGIRVPKCKPECGKISPRGTPNVINGISAVRGEFPWHVGIYTDFGITGQGAPPRYWCGGSILSRSTVISAAHCYYNPRTGMPFNNSFIAAVGKLYSDFNHFEERSDSIIQKSKIMQIEIPDVYKGEAASYSHDLALLVLETPLTFSDLILPVCLDLEDMIFDNLQSAAGVIAKVVGFGLVDVTGSASEVLKTANMAIITNNECIAESPPEFSKYVVYDKLCAGYKNGTGVCKGDSGGGLVVETPERSSSTWYLRGIVSTSPASDTNAKCSINTYSTFTRPIYYKGFIEGVLNREGCVVPNSPSNGKFTLNGFQSAEPGSLVRHGSQIKLICDKGFIPSDEEANFCAEFIDDWIKDFPTCIGPPNDKLVVCYVSAWAVHRPGKGKFTIDNIDPQLCTHIVYCFAGLNADSWTIHSLDKWRDLKEGTGLGSYEKATGLKQKYPHLKVTLGIGGWNEGSKNYSELAADPAKRKAFKSSVIQFLKKYNFDGLDFHWEYPALRDGMPHDKENYVKLVKELKAEFMQHDLLLTAAFAASVETASNAYDIASLSKYLDLMHIKSYDYHGTWDPTAGPNAPLVGIDETDFISVEATVNYMLEQGADPSKLVLGIPLHGRNFIKVSPDDVDEIGVMTQSEGFEGRYSHEPGYMGYNEICLELSNSSGGWNQFWHNRSKTPYAVNGDKIIVYDNERSLVEKVRFAIGKGLRGVMAWTIDTDDFRGDCTPEEGAYQEFYESIKDIKNTPFYKDVVDQLSLPRKRVATAQNSSQDVNSRSSGGTYKIEKGELTLVLPHRSQSNFPLLRILNEALVFSEQDVIVRDVLMKKNLEMK